MNPVSMQAQWLAGGVLLAVAGTAGYVTHRVTGCFFRTWAAYCAILAAGFTAQAAWMFGAGDRPAAAVHLVSAALAAALAWWLWRKRPPRKRRPSKIAARVRDLGHRLTTTPVAVTA